MKKQTKNKKINKKKLMAVYIAAVLLLIYLIYIIYLLIKQPTNIFTVEEGKLYKEETNVGYVIRNEKVVKGDNYKNGMEPIVAEGSRAAVNEKIFRYYSNNEENLKQKIAELDLKIQTAMAQDIGAGSADAKIMENQIDEKMQDINRITDVSKLNEYKKEIESLVAKKAKIAGESSPKGSYLRKLIDQRKQYESELNSGAEYVKAPMSGIVSYRVDGLEDVLTPNNFSSLSKEYLENLNLSTGKIVASNDEAGKVIDNFECYIATYSSSEEAKNAKVGDKVKVRLSNNAEINAEITNLIIEDDEVTIILKIQKQIEELINYRKITFDLIWWSASGIKVPNQAIVKQDNLDYVVRNRAGYLSKVLVNVKKQGDKYSIVDAYSTEELEKMGMSKTEASSSRNLSIYDEILINPDLSKVK